jgi:hypothetical protein
MKIRSDKFMVDYDVEHQSLNLQGSMRLHNMQEEYKSLVSLLEEVVSREPSYITLHIEELNFLNSLGISLLSKFVIHVRNSKSIGLNIVGSSTIPWQGRSIKNLQRLMPNLKLEWI